jgi:hypothetical protein
MSDVFKVPESYHVSYDKATGTAESSFAGLCRMVEAANMAAAIELINTAPLFLFDTAKAKKAMAYSADLDAKTAPIHLPFHEFTMSDPLGAVWMSGTVLSHNDMLATLAAMRTPRLKGLLEDNEAFASYADKALGCMEQSLKDSPLLANADEYFYGTAIVYLSGLKGKMELDMLHNGVALIVKDTRAAKSGWIGFAVQRTTRILDHGRAHVVSDDHKEYQRLLIGDFMTNIMTALGQAQYVCQPRLTLIESSPRKTRDIHNKRPIRVHERSQVLFLDPEELRVVYEGTHVPQGTHASPIPHPRKAHTVTFRHERYKRMRGKTIFIHEIHVKAGDSWKSSQGRIYKVMELDDKEGDTDEVEQRPGGDAIPPVQDGTAPQENAGIGHSGVDIGERPSAAGDDKKEILPDGPDRPGL